MVVLRRRSPKQVDKGPIALNVVLQRAISNYTSAGHIHDGIFTAGICIVLQRLRYVRRRSYNAMISGDPGSSTTESVERQTYVSLVENRFELYSFSVYGLSVLCEKMTAATIVF